MTRNLKNPFLKLIAILFLMSLFLSSCSELNSEAITENPLSEPKQFLQNLPYTEIEIYLEVPKPTESEIIFELIDDITGIELNPTRYVMSKTDDQQYQLTLPIKVPSQIKYRFYKNNGLPIYETDADNKVIEYRMAYISNETVIQNVLTNWQDEQYDHKYGRITGQVLNSETNSPIPNALIVIGNKHGYTNSLGNFQIERIPAGKHNLVISSTDGEYQTFQQEAIIGEGLTTQANIGLKSAEFVEITFIVNPPENTPELAAMRILGNTYQLGNVFGNIYNGTSIAPARAPKLTSLPDGNYAITLRLPVGFDLRYKYSLGDGFWNAELNNDGNFVVRQLIVPDKETVINDVIGNWGSIEDQKIDFVVNIPENTPNTDVISIQFNSFGWSPPIQMWKTGDYQWQYQLLSPLHMVGKTDYKFCRNDACEIAYDSSAPVNGYSFDTSNIPTRLDVNITSWNGWGIETEEPELSAPEITQRSEEFVAGFSISNDYNVYTPIHIDKAYQNMLEVNANTVIIPVNWTLSSLNPLVLEPITGKNPLWKDLVLMIQKAQRNNLKVWLAPQIEVSSESIKQLTQNDLSENWELKLQEVFDEFLFYSVDLANYMNIEGIVIPTTIVLMPNVENYEKLSLQILKTLTNNIDDYRARFGGKYFISFDNAKISDTDILNVVDGYLITLKIDMLSSDYVDENYESTIKNYLEEVIYKNYFDFGKPIVLGLNFPSSSGTEKGCIMVEDQCLDFDVINNLDFQQAQSTFTLDLDTQIELINASLVAVNELDWINGLVSLEYNPQVAIMDHSSSVRGKPSIGVFWYWYPRLIGVTEE